MTGAVHLLGGSQTDFAQKAGAEGLAGMFAAVVPAALDVARVDTPEIQVAHVGNFIGELIAGQGHLGGMLLAMDPAFFGVPATRHEGACASGSLALLAAMADIESGRYDVALVVGIEEMRRVPGAKTAELLGCAAWAGREFQGEEFPWPATFAMIADEYGTRYGIEHEYLARICELNLSHARNNPNAQTRGWEWPDSFGEDDANPVVRGMLRKRDCGRITDGAAAVVLCSSSFARDWAWRTGEELPPVIAGWGHGGAPLTLEQKLASSQDDPYVFPHLRRTIADAISRAGLSSAWDLDILEAHDCFSISEYVVIDHAGLTPPGQSWQAIDEDRIGMDGDLPINPSGGLIGAGHPVGSTGVRMMLDAWKQVTDSAGDYQVPGATTAGMVNIGGSYTTTTSFVVRR